MPARHIRPEAARKHDDSEGPKFAHILFVRSWDDSFSLLCLPEISVSKLRQSYYGYLHSI